MKGNKNYKAIYLIHFDEYEIHKHIEVFHNVTGANEVLNTIYTKHEGKNVEVIDIYEDVNN